MWLNVPLKFFLKCGSWKWKLRRSRLIRFHHCGNLQARSANVKACGIYLVHVRARALVTEWWKSLFFRLWPTKQEAPICVVWQRLFKPTCTILLLLLFLICLLGLLFLLLVLLWGENTSRWTWPCGTSNASARRHLPSACSLEAWRGEKEALKSNLQRSLWNTWNTHLYSSSMSDMAERRRSEPAVNDWATLNSFWFLQRRNTKLIFVRMRRDENRDELFWTNQFQFQVSSQISNTFRHMNTI